MGYQIGKQKLMDILRGWDSFLKKRLHLIACGGTALTLLGVKESTKDIDLMVPEINEYNYLIKIIKELGYKPVTGWGWARGDGFVFDLFPGNRVHTTELLDSPLKEINHILIIEMTFIYLGALNYYDIIISKIFRGTSVDIDDCLALITKKGGNINLDLLKRRFKETASFDISEEKVNKNFERFLSIVNKKRRK